MDLKLRESSFKGIEGAKETESKTNCKLIEEINNKIDKANLENAKANEESKSYFVE